MDDWTVSLTAIATRVERENKHTHNKRLDLLLFLTMRTYLMAMHGVTRVRSLSLTRSLKENSMFLQQEYAFSNFQTFKAPRFQRPISYCTRGNSLEPPQNKWLAMQV